MVKGHHGHQKKMEPNGQQSWVIDHHIAQVEEIHDQQLKKIQAWTA